MQIDIKSLPSKDDCTGCGACAYACNKKAITMQMLEGFHMPVVDNTKCVKCNMCVRVCPLVQLKCKKKDSYLKAHYAFSKSKAVRQKSSSGGVFYHLAESIISKNKGYVVGAAFAKDYHAVKHCMVNHLMELDKISRSKYIQSRSWDSYNDIKKCLENGSRVLFCGTPCQAAAVRSLFFKYDNLYIVDFICHGVPSPLVWHRYLSFLEDKYGLACDVNFRCKKNGWDNYSLQINFEKKSIIESKTNNVYLKGFLSGLFMRKSCYKCPFRKPENRESDITIGDCWGIKKINNDINFNDGVSVVISRNIKGERLLQDIKDYVILEPLSIGFIKRNNESVRFDTYRFPKRKTFFDKIDILDIVTNIENNLRLSFIDRFDRKLWIIMNNMVKKINYLFEREI